MKVEKPGKNKKQSRYRASVKKHCKKHFCVGIPEKKAKKMEPAVGFEPTTDGLQNRSSTTELSWLGYPLIYTVFQICQARK